ncbi:MAG: hypothetical protein O2963_00110 [Proteobacteria bacterium]|nr:hypothetical protein [Pseudomonadota bacterium]
MDLLASAGSGFIQGRLAKQQHEQSQMDILLRQREAESSQRSQDFSRLKVFIDTEGKVLSDLLQKGDATAAKEWFDKRKQDPELRGMFERTGMINADIRSFENRDGKSKAGMSMPAKMSPELREKMKKRTGLDSPFKDGDIVNVTMSTSGELMQVEKSTLGQSGDIDPRDKLLAETEVKAGLRTLDAIKSQIQNTESNEDRDKLMDALSKKSDEIMKNVESRLFTTENIAPTGSAEPPTNVKEDAIKRIVALAKTANTLEEGFQRIEANRDTLIENNIDIEKIKDAFKKAFQANASLKLPTFLGGERGQGIVPGFPGGTHPGSGGFGL